MHDASRRLQDCLADMYDPEWFGKEEMDSLVEVRRGKLPLQPLSPESCTNPAQKKKRLQRRFILNHNLFLDTALSLALCRGKP